MNKRSALESRQKILEAARGVFAEHGYAEASMRSIAKEAGISVGGLYLYFRNKEELYHSFMQEWMKNLNDRTDEALAGIDDPVKALDVFITTSIEFARTHREMITLQGREIGFSFGGEYKRAFFLERRLRIAGIIRKGSAGNIFQDCDADEAAKVIFNMLRGFVFSMVVDEDSLFSPAESVNLLLKGLLRRNNG